MLPVNVGPGNVGPSFPLGSFGGAFRTLGDKNPTLLQQKCKADFRAIPPGNCNSHASNPARSAGKNLRFWCSGRAKPLPKVALPGAAQACVFATFCTRLVRLFLTIADHVGLDQLQLEGIGGNWWRHMS